MKIERLFFKTQFSLFNLIVKLLELLEISTLLYALKLRIIHHVVSCGIIIHSLKWESTLKI